MERRGALQVMAQLLTAAVVADRGLHRASHTQSSSSSSSSGSGGSSDRSSYSSAAPGLDLSRAVGLRFSDAIAPHARLLAAALVATISPAASTSSGSHSSSSNSEESAAHVVDPERRAGRGAALEATAFLLLLRRSSGSAGGSSGSGGQASLLPSVTTEKLLARLMDVALGSSDAGRDDDGSVSARGALCLAVGSHCDDSGNNAGSSSSALLLPLLPRLLGALSPQNEILASTDGSSAGDGVVKDASSSPSSPLLFRNALALLSQLMALPVALVNTSSQNGEGDDVSGASGSPLAHTVGTLVNHATLLLLSPSNNEAAVATAASDSSTRAQAASLIVAAARIVQKSEHGLAQQHSASDSLNRAAVACKALLGAASSSQSSFEPLSDGPTSEKRLKVEQPKTEQQPIADTVQAPLPALLATLQALSVDSETTGGSSALGDPAVVAAASELLHAMTSRAAEVDADVVSSSAAASAVEAGSSAAGAWALARVFQALAPAMPAAAAMSESPTGVRSKNTSLYLPLLAAAVDAAPAHPSPALPALVAAYNHQHSSSSSSSSAMDHSEGGCDDPRMLLNALLSASLASTTMDGGAAAAEVAARETAARCLSDLLHKLPPKGGDNGNSSEREWSLAAWVAALADENGEGRSATTGATSAISQNLHQGVFARSAFFALSAAAPQQEDAMLQCRVRALLWLCRGALSRAPPLPSPVWKQLAGLLAELIRAGGGGDDDKSGSLALLVAQSLDLLVNDNPSGLASGSGSRSSSSAPRLGLWRQRLWSTLAEPLLDPASSSSSSSSSSPSGGAPNTGLTASPAGNRSQDVATTAPLVAIAKLTAHASAAVVGVGMARGATVATVLVRALARADRLAGAKAAAAAATGGAGEARGVISSNEEAEMLRSAALEGLVAMARLAEKQQLAQSSASVGDLGGNSGGDSGEEAVVPLGTALSKHAGTLLELLPRLAGSAAIPRNRVVMSSSSSAPTSAPASSTSSSSSPATRARALVLLHLLSTPGSAAALPGEARVPHQAQVTRALGLALDDPVPAVRRLAAALRNEWAVL